MTIIEASNYKKHVINMSKRVKTKPKVRSSVGSEMTRKNVVDKESADRIAAAEAMSCLSSSPFILPPSSTSPESSVRTADDQEVNSTMSVSKRVKSRGRSRGGKRSPAKLPQTNALQGGSVTSGSKNANTSESSKRSAGPQSTTVTIQSLNASMQASFIAQQLSNLVKKQKEKTDDIPSHSNIKFSLQQMLELKKAQVHEHLQGSNNPVLKLPLKSTTEIRDAASPSSVASSESIELTQTAVDHILNPNKYDTPEASLPLKKRRLQTYKDGEAPPTDSGGPTQGTVDLTTDKPNQSKEQPAGSLKATSSGAFVNPKTSLMLLSEIQMALHQDEDGDLPLHIAVAQENIVMVQKFVHLMTISGKSVDKYNRSQQTPLHLAVELQFDQAVSVLLMAGANPSLVNKHGDNSVHLSIKYNTINNLALMLIKSQHKADINARNFEGLAPLHLAVVRNQIEMVKVLIRCGADINIQDGKSGRTPLFHAVEGNQLALVMLFRQCNANLELTNYAGVTALMAAQAKGFSEACSILMVGLDPKAIIEHKEKEKMMMPNKKMPIPRIPSKAHLIVPGNLRQMKKDGNDEVEDDLQGTSQDIEVDVKLVPEERAFIQGTLQDEVKNEIKDIKAIFNTLPVGVVRRDSVENETTQRSHPTMQTSHPMMQTSHPTMQTSHPTMQTSHPTMQTSHPTMQTSHPTMQTSHPTMQTSHPTMQTSHPTMQTSHPTMQTSHPMTLNIPIKKEKPKRNKQKKSTKSESNMGSDWQLSSDVMCRSDSPKGAVNSVSDSKLAVNAEQVTSGVRSVSVSNGPTKSSGSVESVTSINARTASLLAAHLKSVKSTLTANKYGSSCPLNLSSNGKETGNLETVSNTVSSSSYS